MPPVYPILDSTTLYRRGFDPVEAAEALLEGGAEILQFRHKEFWDQAAFETARRMAEMCGKNGAIFVVNDRADYAALLGAGLHVGQEDLAPSDARRVVGEGTLLGFSTHNAAQLEAGNNEPISYLAFGPVFPTLSKESPDPTAGVAALRHGRTLTTKPLVAIGGITRANARECWDAGADSVAVIGDLLPEPITKRTLSERMAEWLRLK